MYFNKPILVADDNKDIRELVVFLLKGEGYKVDAVDNLEAAFRKWNEGNYGLLLLDNNYEGVHANGNSQLATGADLVDMIRQSDGTPIIMMSAYTAPIRHYGQKHTDVMVIAKPFDIDVILDAVKGYIGNGISHERAA